MLMIFLCVYATECFDCPYIRRVFVTLENDYWVTMINYDIIFNLAL